MEDLIGEIVWRLSWRVAWWLLRLLWLPFLILVIVVNVVVPALFIVARLVFSPSGLLAAFLLFLWLRRR